MVPTPLQLNSSNKPGPPPSTWFWMTSFDLAARMTGKVAVFFYFYPTEHTPSVAEAMAGEAKHKKYG